MTGVQTKPNLVRGAGGGGGKGGGGGTARAAVEDPDSLRSRQYAMVLDAISEGEIVGLVNGAKDVYLDDTPLQNADNSFNFTGVTLRYNSGTQAQSYIPGFSDTENEVAVGLEVKATNGSVTRAITNINLDRVRVTLGFPRLTRQDTTTGDLHGTTVQVQIYVQTYVSNVGGGFGLAVINDVIAGKATTRYQRAYNLILPKPANVTGWDIKVVRVTADATSASVVDNSWWDSYTEIADVKLRYPNTACIGLCVDASQFSAIPKRAYKVKLLKIKVPTNYDPVARTYTGNWDGTFKIAWSDNPAWCFYDLVTNARYGLGEFISEAQVDKWSLYTIAQYCDELVPNGFGGTEPRFTCNLYLQTRQEAYKVITDMASIFRAMVYWSGGKLMAVQDAPSSPVALLTAANVIDGTFHYEGSSRRARHTVALVSWNDPTDRYTQKIEYVEDAAGIARYGVVQTEIVAFGCTSRGQAHRLGKWTLLSELTDTETVTSCVGLVDVSVYRPGAIVKVLDNARAGKRWGGRIAGIRYDLGGDAYTLDAPTDSSSNSLTLEAGKTYTLNVVMPDGTITTGTVISPPNTVTSYNVNTIIISPTPNQVPVVGAVWVLEETNLVAKPFRVLTVKEAGKASYELTGLAYNASKYAAVEQGLALQTLPVTSIDTTLSLPVTNITSTESLYIVKGDIKVRLHIGWDAPSHAARYRVEYRFENGNWQTLPDVNSNSAELLDIANGHYDIRVSAISWADVPAAPVAYSVNVLGKTAPPGDVTGLYLTRLKKSISLNWNAVPDLDLYAYEVRKGVLWETAAYLATVTDTTVTLDSLLSGTILVKALDTTGHYSVNPAVVIVADVSSVNITLVRDDAIRASIYLSDPIGSFPVTGHMSHPLHGFTLPERTIEVWTKPNLDVVSSVVPGIPAPVFQAESNVVLSNMIYDPNYAGGMIFRANPGPASMLFTFSIVNNAGVPFDVFIDLGLDNVYNPPNPLVGNVTLTLMDGAYNVVGTATITPTTSATVYHLTGSFPAGAAANAYLSISFANSPGTAGEWLRMAQPSLKLGTDIPSSGSAAIGLASYWQTGDGDAFSTPNKVSLGLSGTDLVFWVNQPSGTAQELLLPLDSTKLAKGLWSQIIATYSASAMTLSIRQEGGVRTTTTLAGPITVPTDLTSLWGQFGGMFGKQPTGLLDEVRIYNRALTTTEFDEHYNMVFNNESGLVGYWPMTEGSGPVAQDMSPNRNDATLDATTTHNPLWSTDGAPGSTWRGVKTNMTADGTYLKSISSTSSYETTEVDIGVVCPVRVDIHADIQQVPSGVNTINAVYEIARKNLPGDAYGPWEIFSPGLYQTRYLKIRATITNTDTVNNYAQLRSLQVAVDVEDRIVHFEDVRVDATTGATLRISPAFVHAKLALVSIQAAAVGDTYRVSVAADSVTVYCYTSAGVAKTAVVDIDVFGYGEKIV